VVVDEDAIGNNGTIGEAVCALLQRTVRFNKSTVIDLFAGGVLDLELNPRLPERGGCAAMPPECAVPGGFAEKPAPPEYT